MEVWEILIIIFGVLLAISWFILYFMGEYIDYVNSLTYKYIKTHNEYYKDK